MTDILSIASSRLWLITPDALETLVHVANREGNPENLFDRVPSLPMIWSPVVTGERQLRETS
jgi:hypothetical protein